VPYPLALCKANLLHFNPRIKQQIEKGLEKWTLLQIVSLGSRSRENQPHPPTLHPSKQESLRGRQRPKEARLGRKKYPHPQVRSFVGSTRTPQKFASQRHSHGCLDTAHKERVWRCGRMGTSRSLTWYVFRLCLLSLLRTDKVTISQLEHPKLKSQGLHLEGIKAIVKADSKQRYDLILENSDGIKLEAISPGPMSPMSEVGPTASSLLSSKEPLAEGTSSGGVTNDKKDLIWLIKARQGHSIKVLS
jgi:hypothetical protein